MLTAVTAMAVITVGHKWNMFNHLRTKLNNFNFHPLEDVSRYRNPQLQVGENYSYVFDLRRNFANLEDKNTFRSR